ncbi:P2X purinoceptor 7-like [Saccostrea cucullata]|uniref:P2X purinoceptor 7-like n=1 Tax=Saccostrea cuccullata TaxID=36930 RepID=UPI002ED1D4A9
MANSSDSDGDISKIDLSVKIRPYMFEPIKENNVIQIENESSSSSSDGEHGETGDENITADHNVANANDWCSCGNCVTMPTPRENKCCRKTNIVDGKIEDQSLTCITDHEGFIVNCLNKYVLETSYYEYIQENGQLEENEHIHELYRYLAYRRFVRWIYQRLGKKNRRILPSCVVIKIRKTFPSEEYCGFKYPN